MNTAVYLSLRNDKTFHTIIIKKEIKEFTYIAAIGYAGGQVYGEFYAKLKYDDDHNSTEFTLEEILQKHVKFVHTPKEVLEVPNNSVEEQPLNKSDICPKRFSTAAVGSMKNKCDQCEKEYNSNYSLQEHRCYT